jgi:hypothetical protein
MIPRTRYHAPIPMKRPSLRIFMAIMACALLPSCAGYELGGRKPKSLAGVERIAVPMFGNATQHPRAEALATSAVADALIRDGAYRIASVQDADAVLEGRISAIDYSTVRGTRFDTLLAEEFRNTVTLSWTLRDARDPTRVLARGQSNGTSQLFRDSNLQTARNNALNDALENAADSLVSRIADGF